MKKYNKLSKKEYKEFAESYMNKHSVDKIMTVKKFKEIKTNKLTRIDKRAIVLKDDMYGIYSETDEIIILDVLSIAENYKWKRYSYNQKNKEK